MTTSSGVSEPYVDQNRNKVFDLGEPFTDISGNGLRDTDPLAEIEGLPSLTDLHLYNNRLQSLDSLKDLPNLRTLLLSGNLIKTLSNLRSFDRLEQLSLANNDICELEGLEKLQNLRRLNLDENHICDLRPIRGLNRLHTLNIHSNLLLDLSNLEGLSGLVFVGLSRNFLEDISPLLLLPKLSNLVLSHNYLDLDQEKNQKNLSTLQNKGVYTSLAGQKRPTPQPFSLIESFLGHAESSHRLAEFLRPKGFNGLNEFVSTQPFNESVMEDIMTRWESSLKKSGKIPELYYPN